MPSVIVPITPGMNQSVSCTLPVNNQNISLTFQFTYNGVAGYWFMSITNSANMLLVDALPLVTGNYPAADLLRQYQYLGIGSAYLVPISNNMPDIPGFDDLGVNFLLVWTDGAA